MRKLCLLMAAAVLTTHASNAQKLYGTSVAAGGQRALYSFDPANNSFGTIIKTFEYYQPVSTKDTARKIMYFMAPNLSSTSTNPDTLVIVKLADSTLTTKPFEKASLPYPHYYNDKLISISAKGMVSFDLLNNQYNIIDTNFKITGVHSADFDRTRGRYICMKRFNALNVVDSIYVYTVATKALQRYGVPTIAGNSNEMCYSPTSDKCIFIGIPQNTANMGLYSFHLGTQQLANEVLFANTGTLVNCSTMDQTGNRYFCVKITNTTGTGFNILEYRLNTNTLVDHLVGPPGLGFPQFFDHLRVTAPPSGNSVGNLNAEEPFTMYPNPAGNELMVNIDAKGTTPTIKIIDITGKTVMEKNNAQAKNTLTINHLPKGNYVLQIVFKEAIYSRLFVKS